MTDKELIKQEIKKLIERAQAERVLHPQTILSAKNFLLIEDYNKLLSFIDSLQEEPASDGLEEEIKSWIPAHIEGGDESREVVIEWSEIVARHFAEWQREKDYKMYAHVPLKDIHDAWQELKKNKPDIEKYPAICFQKGVDWQKQKIWDESTSKQ